MGSSRATKDGVADDLPDRGRYLAQPARRDHGRRLVVGVVGQSDREPPQPLADRAGPRDDEALGEQAGERLALDVELDHRRGERGGTAAREPHRRTHARVDRKGAGPLPAGAAGRAPPPRLASLVDRKRAGPLPAGAAGRAPPPRLASLVDRKGAGPLPAGAAGRAPPPRLASLVDVDRRLEAGRAPVARLLGVPDEVVVAAGLGEDR